MRTPNSKEVAEKTYRELVEESKRLRKASQQLAELIRELDRRSIQMKHLMRIRRTDSYEDPFESDPPIYPPELLPDQPPDGGYRSM